MKNGFVPTENYRRFAEAIKNMEGRGAQEACFVLVVGEPGRSKSNITEGWAARLNNGFDKPGVIYLRANKGWKPTFFRRELARQLGIDSGGNSYDLFNRLIDRLAYLGFPKLVVDEVQHCLDDRAAVLESLRDITDRTNSIAVLVAGDDDANRNLLNAIKRHKNIASRIGQVVEFELATPQDVTLICRQLAEVEVAPDLIARIHRDCGGVMRKIMNAVATVERIAKTSGLTRIDDAQFKASGAPLCVDWQAAGPRRSA